MTSAATFRLLARLDDGSSFKPLGLKLSFDHSPIQRAVNAPIPRQCARYTTNKRKKIAMQMQPCQFQAITRQFATLKERSPFYARKFAGIDLGDIKTQSDFEKLPFTEKADLREAYPLGLAAVPQEKIVRIHSSSGTTGTPVIIPYTAKDVHDWAIQFARCYEYAGITTSDRIQITPGYGLWTAGVGFQLGAEMLGAMAIPMGPGNTDKQLQFMMDMQSTVLCATSSYALLLAEEIARRNIRSKINLRKGVIGSEHWGEKMRTRIVEELGVELYDIYGLTEIYGPGIGINCQHGHGMHIWSDYVYLEIVNPETGEVLPAGEEGEVVLTTLQKEGLPLIRFRTHDLSRIILGECPCGHNEHPRLDTIAGRTDDMVKARGVNLFPAQIEEALELVEGTSSEYQVTIDHIAGRDVVTLFFETTATEEGRRNIEQEVQTLIKGKIGLTLKTQGIPIGHLPRSEKKAERILDYRQK